MRALPSLRPLRDPLLHFGAAGAVLATLVAAARPDRHVVVWDEASEAAIVRALEAELGRPPRPDELEARRKLAVEREILVREAVARGLHLRDPVIRRRLLEKMEAILVAEGGAAAAADPAPAPATEPWVVVDVCRHADRPESEEPVACDPGPVVLPDAPVPLERVRRALGPVVAATVAEAVRDGALGTWRAVPGDDLSVRVRQVAEGPAGTEALRAAHRRRREAAARARAAALASIVERYEVRREVP